MIKCENGIVRIEGDIIKIYANFATIVHSLKNTLMENVDMSEDEAKQRIRGLTEDGLKTEAELAAEVRKNRENKSPKISDADRELLKRFFGID